MEVVFIAGLYNLELDSSIKTPLQIAPSLKLGFGPQLVDRLVSPARRKMIGSVEYLFLTTQPFVYWVEDLSPGTNVAEYHLAKVRTIIYLLHWTWVRGDNAVNVDRGYVFFRTNGEPDVYSNFVGIVQSDSSGNARRAMKWDLEVVDFLREMAPPENIPDPGKVEHRKTTNRLDRAVYFISAARAAGELGMKVIFFCSALEALFSSSNTEISQLLSLRTSIYVCPEGSERFETYTMVKKAYDIRSKIIHGEVPKESDKLTEAASNCDTILRKIFEKAYSSEGGAKLFAENTETFGSKFTKAQLGIKVPDVSGFYPGTEA